MNSLLIHIGLLICQPQYGADLLSSLKNINLKDLPATPSFLALRICLHWKPTYPAPEWSKICLPEVPDLWFPIRIPHSLQDLTCLYFMVTAATAASHCYLSSSSLLYSRSSCVSAWLAQPAPILNSYLWCPRAIFLRACAQPEVRKLNISSALLSFASCLAISQFLQLTNNGIHPLSASECKDMYLPRCFEKK